MCSYCRRLRLAISKSSSEPTASDFCLPHPPHMHHMDNIYLQFRRYVLCMHALRGINSSVQMCIDRYILSMVCEWPGTRLILACIHSHFQHSASNCLCIVYEVSASYISKTHDSPVKYAQFSWLMLKLYSRSTR